MFGSPLGLDIGQSLRQGNGRELRGAPRHRRPADRRGRGLQARDLPPMRDDRQRIRKRPALLAREVLQLPQHPHDYIHLIRRCLHDLLLSALIIIPYVCIFMLVSMPSRNIGAFSSPKSAPTPSKTPSGSTCWRPSTGHQQSRSRLPSLSNCWSSPEISAPEMLFHDSAFTSHTMQFSLNMTATFI